MEKRNYWRIIRFVLFFAIIAALILFLWPGCAIPTTPTGSPPTSIGAIETRLAALEAWRPNVDSSIANKALKSNVDSLTTKVNALDVGTGLSAAQVDAAIDAKLVWYTTKISALETRIATLESNGSSSSSSSSPSGGWELIDSDRSLELYLERISPSSDPPHLSAGVDDVTFDLVVKNTDNDHHDFALSLWLRPEDSTVVTQGNCVVASYPGLGNWTITRDNWGDTRDKLYFAMDFDEFIQDREEEDFTIVITVDATVATFWDWRWTIEETD